MHMFNVSTLYRQNQIAPSKAVVGVDLPMIEGTIYAYTKALLGKNCLSSHSCHFFIFLTELLHAYVQCVFIV